jgi:hypothetical protein
MGYWNEIFRRAFTETKTFVGSLFVKIVPPILAAFLLWREFGIGSISSLTGLLTVATCLIEAYGMVFAAIYGWKVIAAIPMLLHERDATIVELKPSSLPVFRAVIEQMNASAINYDSAHSILKIWALVQVRALGTPPETNIHGIQLWFLSDPQHRSREVGVHRRFDGRVLRRREEFIFDEISFDQAGKATLPGSKWKLTFKDVYDKEYESEVFIKPST